MKKGLIIVLILALFSLFGCAKSKGFTKTIYVFDTYVNINLYEGSEQNLNDIVDCLNQVNKIADPYHKYEGIINICYVNEEIKKGNKEIPIDLRLFGILNGYYNTFVGIDSNYKNTINIAIGNLTNLWKDAISTKTLPDQNIIDKYLLDYEDHKYDFRLNSGGGEYNVSVDDDSQVCFDLGSFIKGYASYLVKEYLEENNIKKYMIDFGQSSILVGEKVNGDGFNVLVSGTDYVIKNIKNSFIGTASILERNATIDGKLYHHIIDPLTGMPVSTYDTVVVTKDIIGDSACDDTDVLATYLMIRPDKADEMINWYKSIARNYHFYFFKDGMLVKEVC